jgi:hypothetical protein
MSLQRCLSSPKNYQQVFEPTERLEAVFLFRNLRVEKIGYNVCTCGQCNETFFQRNLSHYRHVALSLDSGYAARSINYAKKL